ncbi:hypothetical protein, partial [Escherichia coli]|uniref:hypothetical protein n=1 Tax=Escherichia coli TaxID=562 RepID=UPI002024AD8E
TAHGGVVQGAVTADTHTGAIAGGAAGDDTVSDIATDVHTVTGGIAGDGAVAAVAQVTADADAGTVSTATAH